MNVHETSTGPANEQLHDLDTIARMSRITDVIAAVRRYIDRYRPVLLRARGRWYKPAADELWISHDGSPCSSESFKNIVKKHVVGPNGRPFSPHLFRSMAVTSISIEAPDLVDIIPVILTHARTELASSITISPVA